MHMPRIGTGLSEGNWSVVSELIDEQLARHGLNVTVYTLPKWSRGAPAEQRGRHTALLQAWSGG